jgi:hypothetical protein
MQDRNSSQSVGFAGRHKTGHNDCECFGQLHGPSIGPTVRDQPCHLFAIHLPDTLLAATTAPAADSLFPYVCRPGDARQGRKPIKREPPERIGHCRMIVELHPGFIRFGEKRTRGQLGSFLGRVSTGERRKSKHKATAREGPSLACSAFASLNEPFAQNRAGH